MTVWFNFLRPGSVFEHEPINLSLSPCPTVMAAGIAGVFHGQYKLTVDNYEEKMKNKPPYKVPSMAEIKKIKKNGLSIVSTFSGCGGSCLGFRMAGFHVLWANEFVPAAQESYLANCSPTTVLDKRSITDVTVDEILEATDLKPGELDVFEGSPPCQAFSTAGKREKGWGTKKKYEHGAEQCNETLFDEYIRLLRGLQPRAFVAENVSGLVKGKAVGYFKEILAALKDCGYHVEARMLDAQWLGVPQCRQRVIFRGLRNDITRPILWPVPLTYRYSVVDAIPWITGPVMLRDGFESTVPTKDFSKETPPMVVASGGSAYSGHYIGIAPSHMKPGAYGARDLKLDEPCPTVTTASPGNDIGVPCKDTDISRFAIGKEWDNVKEGGKSEKYQNLVKADRQKPSPTICATHGTGSIAGVVHPTEKRKFTIAEVKRICAFPDDFVLTGSYAQQWERLGNSVPPLMMKAVAECIAKELL